MKDDMENASGEGEQECWFEEGGCIELSEMESGRERDCWQSKVNPATPVYGDKPRSKLELIELESTLESKNKFAFFIRCFLYIPSAISNDSRKRSSSLIRASASC